jgi:hypothetical protein
MLQKAVVIVNCCLSNYTTEQSRSRSRILLLTVNSRSQVLVYLFSIGRGPRKWGAAAMLRLMIEALNR